MSTDKKNFHICINIKIFLLRIFNSTLAKEYKIWKQYSEETSLSPGYDTQNEGIVERVGGVGTSLERETRGKGGND